MVEMHAGTDLSTLSEPGVYRYPANTPPLLVRPSFAVASRPYGSDMIGWSICDERGNLIATWYRIDGKWIEGAEPLVHGTHTLIPQQEA